MNHVPPESGTSAMPTKPGTNVAASDAMRTSHAQASESPAPAAGPFDRGDHRLLERADGTDVRVIGLLEPFADVAGRLLELAQVLARRRSPCPRR
jgi:hypothetical protein